MMHIILLGKGEEEEPSVPEKLCLKSKSKAIDGSPTISRSEHAQVIITYMNVKEWMLFLKCFVEFLEDAIFQVRLKKSEDL